MNLPNREATGSNSGTGPKKFDELHRDITMAQIAKAAGVSQGAISSMLNDRNYGIRVSEKTRNHVFKVCRELGYIPNDLRALVRMYPELGGYSLLIASDIPGGLSAPFVTRVAAAAMGALPDPTQGLSVGFYDPETDYRVNQADVPKAVSTFVLSKFLLVGRPNLSLIEMLTRRGLPVMSLGYDAPLPGVVSFVPDYAQAARIALSHLRKLGHARLAIASGPFGSLDGKILEFNRGVRQACEELQIPLEAHAILYGDLSAAAGRRSLDEMLTRSPQPTAIFCVSDAAAIGVIERALALGISVPEKLSVIGCGDDPGALTTNPHLTTVRLPAEAMAQEAIRELDRMVNEDLPPLPRKIVPPLELVERQSCAAAQSA